MENLMALDLNINGFPTSSEDANCFSTATSDGIIRLFDVRENLPRISIDVDAGNESISSALYVHVGGLPRQHSSVPSRLS